MESAEKFVQKNFDVALNSLIIMNLKKADFSTAPEVVDGVRFSMGVYLEEYLNHQDEDGVLDCVALSKIKEYFPGMDDIKLLLVAENVVHGIRDNLLKR